MSYLIVAGSIGIVWLAIELFCAFMLRRNERLRRDDQHEHVPGGLQ